MPTGKAAGYRVFVSVQGGLHRGASYMGAPAASVQLGSSPDGDMVLLDDGVHQRALCLGEEGGHVIVNVTAAGVSFDGVELPIGVKTFDAASTRLQVGAAKVRVELLSIDARSRPRATRARAPAPAANPARP